MAGQTADSFVVANVAPPEDLEAHPEAPADGGHEGDLTTGTGHPAEGHAKAGLPQLDTTTFAGQLFWLVISFALLYFVLSRMAVPKIGGVIADRNARIRGDLDEAAAAQKASEAAVANYEKALSDARTKATKLSDEIRAQVQAESAKQSDAASKQLAADMQKAETRIAEMRAGAMSRLGTIVRETTSGIVEKLMGEGASAAELDAAVNASLKRG